MENELPKRKAVRLKDYDYRKNGCYFITICTYNKQHLFGKIINNIMTKNQYGAIAIEGLKSIEEHHKNVKVLNSVIMPNHIHTILGIQNDDVDKLEYNKSHKRLKGSISTIISSYKSAVSKEIHLAESKAKGMETLNGANIGSDTARSVPTMVWQTRFYEHIIRDEDDFLKIWQYIDENPAKWNDDCYY